MTEGFFPKSYNVKLQATISNFKDINEILPLITFILSVFSSSFGMTKFFLSGPISFLPKNAPLNGLLSLPFVCLCILNTMFGFRTLCIESAFFTSYRKQSSNKTTAIWQTESIEPIISPQYRILAYLAPCMLSLSVNCLRLSCTTVGLRKYLLTYPQYVMGSCFTPFMFEGQKVANSENRYTVRIWKIGTFVNALYIGCLPQCVLLLTDFYKGVHSWDFIGNTLGKQVIWENNNALFKSPYGNTIFAVTSCLFFFLLILTFFCIKPSLKNHDVHCRFLYCLCFPCFKRCIHYSDPNLLTQSNEIAQPINDNQQIEESHAEIYNYKNKENRKKS